MNKLLLLSLVVITVASLAQGQFSGRRGASSGQQIRQGAGSRRAERIAARDERRRQRQSRLKAGGSEYIYLIIFFIAKLNCLPITLR